MTRRELIQKTTLALGYTISAPALMAIWSGCELKHTLSFKPVFFTDEPALLMGDLADVFLPRTTTPGAKDVGVPAFIDAFINAVYTKVKQEKFIQDMNAFNEGSVDRYYRLFTECTPDLQILYVKDQNERALTGASGTSEGWWNSNKAEKPFILNVKELTLLGFFTSKDGATEVLQYNQSPGPYQGCVPLSQVGKAWAT
jgi:hypothetical protein